MAIIKPKRGSGAPSGLLQNELAVDTTNKRIYIGNSGGTGDLIGSAPSGSDTYVQFNDGGNLGGDAGLTYNKTTDTLTISGDLAVNGGDITTSSSNASVFDTGATTVNAFGGATTLNIGYDGTSTNNTTNIAVSTIASGVTRTVNIGTGGLSGVSNINIGYNGGGTTSLNSATIVGGSSTQALFNTVATTINFGGASTNLTMGSTTGTTTTRNPTLIVGNGSNAGTIKTPSTGSLNLTTGAINSGGTSANIVITGDADGAGVVQINGGDLYLGQKVDADPTVFPVNIIFEGSTADGFETTLTLVDPTADRTITLPDATGTVITTGNLTSITSTGTISSGTWNGTAISTSYGGTGLTSYTAGDLLFYSTGTALNKLAIGTSGHVLTSSGSAPQWTSVTGTGDVVKATSPTLTTPNIGVASGTSLAATGTTDTLDIIASTDGVGLRIAQAASGAGSRQAGIRLGRSATAAFNTYIENATGTLSIFNGTSSAGTLILSANTLGISLAANLDVTYGKSISFIDNVFGESLSFIAPSTVPSSITWTLPSTDGSANYVLTTNGSGILSWSSVGVTSITPAADTGTGTAITTSGTITVAGTSGEIETSVSGTTVTVGLPDSVVTSSIGGIINLYNLGII
jgi:hypothetical protein